MNEILDTQIGIVFAQEEAEIKPSLLPAQESNSAPTALSKAEKQTLAQCEATINKHLERFVQVGVSLYTIKSQNLYRETHRTFEEYCRDKWGFTRFHASRLIKAGKVVENISNAHQIGAVSVPPTEAAAREIADLEPEQQVEVAKKVKQKVGDRKPKAKDYKAAKEDVVGKKAPEKTTPPETQPTPENIVSLPAQAAGIPSPREFHKLPALPTLHELSEMATKLENIRANPERKGEFEKLWTRLRQWLGLYAEWETKCLIPAAREAA